MAKSSAPDLSMIFVGSDSQGQRATFIVRRLSCLQKKIGLFANLFLLQSGFFATRLGGPPG